LSRVKLKAALNLTDWSRVHVIKEVNNVQAFIVAGIVNAMDKVALLHAMRVKTKRDLYLSGNNLNLIKNQDDARMVGSKDYRSLRNRCNILVARDKRSSSKRELARSMRDPKRLWQIANQALGKNRPTLPTGLRKDDGTNTSSSSEAADLLNNFYVNKVDRLRGQTAAATAPVAAMTSAAKSRLGWAPRSAHFSFSFASAR
jgi:hypothetical protein